jgi:glycine/D-amino acid oxidase-like deaminating enzyme
MINTGRDLRSGTSLWQARRALAVPTQRLAGDIACDVLIVGAGISGALTAELLAADGHKVAIVDRRGPFRGSTSANTGLITYEIDIPMISLTRKIGKTNAMRAWRRSYLAAHALATRTRALGIRCGLASRPSLYLSGKLLHAKSLQREAEARCAAGIYTRHLARNALRENFGIAHQGALLSYGTPEADPRKLAAGYLCAAIANGATLYAPLDVVAVDAGVRRVQARTIDNMVISSRYLVFATGYEVPHAVAAAGYRIVSTYALATRAQPHRLWPEQCLIWEAAEPYVYVRSTADGRVIAGGEDEEVADAASRDALLPKKIASLRTKLAKLLPGIDTRPAFQWAGTFGVTRTGLPLIGRIPGRRNCWAVLGYGGNGIVYSRIAAEIIRTGLAGGQDADAELYAFPKASSRGA